MPSETVTRKETIDLRLKDAGWNVADRTQVVPELLVSIGIGSASEAERSPTGEFSDYVLLGRNGKPIAVMEAKQSSKDAEIGREQTKQYCHNIQALQGGELPFCSYTNGHEIFFWNLGQTPPRRVHGFPTRQDLERILFIRKHTRPLSDELINTSESPSCSRLLQRPEARSIDQFIAEHPTLTTHQLQVLGLLRECLIDRGGIEKRDLMPDPFTVIHPSGIRGIFSPAEIQEIVSLTERLAA